MPLYDFKCPKCEHAFEEVVSLSEPHPVQCPVCKEEAEKQPSFGGSTFQLKGSGWTGNALTKGRRK